VTARPRALLSWSSGKDSAWALHVARTQAEVEIVGLLTTITDAYQRVSMHGVREALLDAQAAAAGLPVTKVRIPAPCPNEIYEREMVRAMADARAAGVSCVVFGDLFLADLRAWREQRLAEVGMRGVFPIWRRDTGALVREMLAGGLRAVLTCVDPRRVPGTLAGRWLDETLLAELPRDVDPCGENGEFHSFAAAGPMFRAPLDVRVGESTTRDGFVFADVLPGV
jgi:uncharacterized protein (TIGR00290 family)